MIVFVSKTIAVSQICLLQNGERKREDAIPLDLMHFPHKLNPSNGDAEYVKCILITQKKLRYHSSDRFAP
jgi:hypothetical protein